MIHISQNISDILKLLATRLQSMTWYRAKDLNVQKGFCLFLFAIYHFHKFLKTMSYLFKNEIQARRYLYWLEVHMKLFCPFRLKNSVLSSRIKVEQLVYLAPARKKWSKNFFIFFPFRFQYKIQCFIMCHKHDGELQAKKRNLKKNKPRADHSNCGPY